MKKLVLVVLIVLAVGCAKAKSTLDNVVDDVQGVVCPDTYAVEYKECEKSADRLEEALTDMTAKWERCERDWVKYQSKSTR